MYVKRIFYSGANWGFQEGFQSIWQTSGSGGGGGGGGGSCIPLRGRFPR